MIDIGGGDGAVLPRMAPDLLYLSTKQCTGLQYKTVSMTGTTSLVTALQLTGKWAIQQLSLASMVAGSLTVKLTIDGETIWNTTVPTTSNEVAMLGGAASSFWVDEAYMCNSSLKLEVKHSVATTMSLNYLARPIK